MNGPETCEPPKLTREITLHLNELEAIASNVRQRLQDTADRLVGELPAGNPETTPAPSVPGPVCGGDLGSISGRVLDLGLTLGAIESVTRRLESL